MDRYHAIPVFIKEIKQETAFVKSFTLAPVEGNALPRFSSGSHITVYLPSNGGVLERNYSLINHPDHREEYRIAVRLSETSKGGSAYLHQEARPGDRLWVSYPKNHFPLSFRARHHVFYAAGIGITPFLSMMAELHSSGKSFELHYAARSRAECAFYEEIRERYPTRCRFYFSADGSRSRLTTDSLQDHPIGTHVYICGPEAMIAQFREAAYSCGYPKGSVHYERFAPRTPKTRSPFQAELRSSKQIIDVPENQSLLEALLAAGINVPYSCRVGECGTCRIDVLEGEIEHCDSFLTEEEKERHNLVIACVSRARSRKIVLGL